VTSISESDSGDSCERVRASEILPQAECLRTLEAVFEPDPRTTGSETFDGGAFRPLQLADRHAAISTFVLGNSVPSGIRIHFETARNLYLYAWFVYRFFPVAEQHVLGTLEFALRLKMLDVLPPSRTAKWDDHPPTLHPLMNLAIDEGLISCEGLRIREAQARATARERISTDKMQEMIASGLDSIEWDDSNIEPLPRDYRNDWLEILRTNLPKIRNTLAHGSHMLHPTVLGTFAHVTDLINQLYPPVPVAGRG
jgi:hypothetical protein